MELRVSLQPKQKLFREAMDQYDCTFYGGAKGGGKSHGMRNIFLIRRFQYPGSYGAIFRRTYPELEANHIRPLFQEHPELRPYWNEGKKLLTLPTTPESTLQFCHCANEPDVDLYQGREFHDLGIEEAGQWTEAMFRKLQGSNRSSKAGIKARTAITGNPGGIGHAWLKRLFIERRFNERETPQDYHFIQALVGDNPALLSNDPGYVRRLESEPNEALRKAYLYGDWDIFAGQYFSELRREIHFIKPFPIPDHWTRFGGYDYGFNHPAAFGWFACDEDGNVYLYREFIQNKLRVDQQAEYINRFSDTKLLQYIKGGHDCWTVKNTIKQGTPPTVAEEFGNHGIYLQRAAIDRIQGASQLRNYLAWNGTSSGRPRLFIFDTCPLTFDCLTRMQHDPDRVEDVLKVDASEGDPFSGDDPYDMIRYAAMSRPIIPSHIKSTLKPGSPEMLKHQENLYNEQLERQIERQTQHEREEDMLNTVGLDGSETISYYINKRR